jgi:hypothetical protein
VSLIQLRVVVLAVDTDVWCELCALPCATAVVYVEEHDGHAPIAVNTVTYCTACDER